MPGKSTYAQNVPIYWTTQFKSLAVIGYVEIVLLRCLTSEYSRKKTCIHVADKAYVIVNGFNFNFLIVMTGRPRLYK